MSIANTFIRRPVLSTVCTLLILMVGLIAIPQLPINNLPDIAPIQVQTRAFSIGADAQTVEESVSTVIERQINGVEGMQYMTSTSGNDGSSSISAFFAPSSDRNINQVNVQNRVAIAQPTLPASVRQTGVTTVARSNSILRVYGFYAENSEYDNLFCLDNSRFKEVKDFENLVIKTQADGTLIKLKDVGRAELGARDYTTSSLVQGKPGVGMLIYQLPGSNALNTAKALETRLAQLEANFPPGIKSVVCYDTTKFVEVSIEEVVKTLIEAILLVVLVIFIFLQEWRATIIPAITVPVSLIGAMAFAYALGFSLNNLTLFALVLATGLVVDDAIIVVEAIAAKIEEGLSPSQAAMAAMQELSGAVIATSLVLMAVFIPVSFFPGATGIMYQQFALVIIFSIAISTFSALSFTPSTAALFLRHASGEGQGWWAGSFASSTGVLIGY